MDTCGIEKIQVVYINVYMSLSQYFDVTIREKKCLLIEVYFVYMSIDK